MRGDKQRISVNRYMLKVDSTSYHVIIDYLFELTLERRSLMYCLSIGTYSLMSSTGLPNISLSSTSHFGQFSVFENLLSIDLS